VRWLLASAIGAAAGCTLTDKSFDPTPIDDTETKSEPTLPAGPTVSDGMPAAMQETGLPTTGNDAEGVPNVRPPTTQASMLEPGGTSDGADAGAPPVANQGPADAGTPVDAGTTVVEPPVVEQPPGNPCDTLSFGGSCYELFNSFLSWDAAEQQCVAWGGHLVSIGSSDENAFLNGWTAELGLTNGDGQGIWVGGTDAQRDAVFQWVDGSPFSFLGWAPGQPDNGAGVDCIEKRNDGAGQWYDRRCTDSLRYVCERPL
jgi:C-type mannose receptor